MAGKNFDDLYNDLFGKTVKDLSLGYDEVGEKLKQELDDRINKTFGTPGNPNLSSGLYGNITDTPIKPIDGASDNTTASTGEAKPEAAAEEQKEPETDPMEELDALIGLGAIKHDVKELISYVKIQKMREDSGLKTVPTSLHLVFTGNPGTGKTTVARIIARLYKQIGVLSKGQLIEVDRSGLVAGYVGQTAIKTQEKIGQAKGGVLFVDEAYALAKDGNDFGQEAIDTILKAMEDNRKDFVVIVAGYTGPMKKFIESNPGLKSRFNKYIEFADYTIEELTAIFKSYLDKYEYIISDEDLERVTNLLRLKKAQSPENFANAREVRNLFEEVITNQSRRLAELENPTVDDMRQITYDDLYDEDKKEEAQPEESEDADPAPSTSEQPTVDDDTAEK